MILGSVIFAGVAILCIAAFVVTMKKRRAYEEEYDDDDNQPEYETLDEVPDDM